MAIWSSLITESKEEVQSVDLVEEVVEEKQSWHSSAKQIGIDLGYGFVKMLNGDEEVKFSSVVGLGSDLNYQAGLNPLVKAIDNLAVTIDEKTYFIGNLAIKQSELASRSMDQDRVEDLNTKVLLLAGLGILTQWENQAFNLVTGLPASYFAGYKDEWDKKLKGSYQVGLKRGSKRENKRFKINDVKIIPQPFGTLYDRLLNDYGSVANNDLAEMNVAIVDIGFKTTDFAVACEMEYVERLSFCTTTALSSAYRMIAGILRSDYKIDKENFELDQIIEKGEIKLAGKKQDISKNKQAAFAQVANKIVTEMESNWDYRDFDKIYLTGGGGQALAQFLLPRFPNMVLVENSQFANVRGYQKLAKNLFKD